MQRRCTECNAGSNCLFGLARSTGRYILDLITGFGGRIGPEDVVPVLLYQRCLCLASTRIISSTASYPSAAKTGVVLNEEAQKQFLAVLHRNPVREEGKYLPQGRLTPIRLLLPVQTADCRSIWTSPRRLYSWLEEAPCSDANHTRVRTNNSR